MVASRVKLNSVAWTTQRKKEMLQSLSEWLDENSFRDETVTNGFAGRCSSPLLAKLKRIRNEAAALAEAAAARSSSPTPP